MKLGAFVRLWIKDMIRESGDRGTSILNFITNYVLFLAAAHMVMVDAGLDAKGLTLADKMQFGCGEGIPARALSCIDVCRHLRTEATPRPLGCSPCIQSSQFVAMS